MMNILLYILIFIGFLIVVHLIYLFNKSIATKYNEQARKQSNLPELARVLSLTYEDLSKSLEGKPYEFQHLHIRLSGTYKGVPVLMEIKSQAGVDKYLNPGNRFRYAQELYIEFTVNNPEDRQFHIRPKDASQKTTATGISAFDNTLSYAGNVELPSDFLEYVASIGWMDLNLRDKRIKFTDTFYDQFYLVKGFQMIGKQHPLWGTTPGNYRIDISRAKEFFDQIISLIKKVPISK